MVSIDVVVNNELGLHARAAAKFVDVATAYSCEVWVAKEGHRVNGKSIMGVMMLAASRGSAITLIAEGEDEQDAVNRLAELIAQRFGEEE